MIYLYPLPKTALLKTICLSIVLFALFLQQAKAQPGCTDVRASNFDAAAGENNGSCKYPKTVVSPVVRANLSSNVRETSGLLYDKGYLWTHNDSGNQPILYKLDTTTGQIIQQVTLANVGNIDWEDLAQDDQHIYIGDFGNNDGDRTDLRVLVVNKADIGAGSQVTVIARVIRFSYPDQHNFRRRTLHNFDCEAFICHNDTLHLFTKNWANKQTKHYTLPTLPGTYLASLIDSFNVGCTITGASVVSGGSQVILIGYDKDLFTACTWLLWDYPSLGSIWQGNKRRLELPSLLFVGQVEAVAFKDMGRCFISNEERSPVSTKLFVYDVAKYGQILTSFKQTVKKSQTGPSIVQNQAEGKLQLVFQQAPDWTGQLEVADAKGQIWQRINLTPSTLIYDIDTVQLPSGTYFLYGKGPSASLKLSFIHPK
jgi:hypothetical protein